MCIRDRGAQKPDRRGEGRQRSRGALMDGGGRLVAPRRHVHLFVCPPRVTSDTSLYIKAQSLNTSEGTLLRLNCSLEERGEGSGPVKGPPSHLGGGNEIRTQQMPFNLRYWDLVLGHFQPRNCIRELHRTQGMKTDSTPTRPSALPELFLSCRVRRVNEAALTPFYCDGALEAGVVHVANVDVSKLWNCL